MWPNSQKTADLVTFTEKIKSLMENFIFCAVLVNELHLGKWVFEIEFQNSI